MKWILSPSGDITYTLTLSTAVDSSPVDPPANALSGHPPVSDGDTAVTQHVLEVAGAALVIGTGSHRRGVSPESLTAIEILLVFLQHLEKKVEGTAKTYGINVIIHSRVPAKVHKISTDV